MKSARWAACLILVFVLVNSNLSLARAQGQVLGVRVEQVDSSAFPKVTLRLSAWDANGIPLSNLLPADITLMEDGGTSLKPLTVETDNKAPLSVVLVLDVSSSMKGAPLDDAKAAAVRFLDRLAPADQAALIAFSSPVDPDSRKLNPNRELSFSTNKDNLYDLIERLSSDGGTHLYNAAAKSVNLFEGMPAGHRAVLLLTDGKNEPVGEGDPQQPIQLAQKTNIPFFVIGLGNDIDEDYLRSLASQSGGIFRKAPKSSELARLFDEMATLLKTQFLVTYTSNLPADGGTHTLDLIVSRLGSEGKSVAQLGPLPLVKPPTTTPTIASTPTLTVTTIPPTQTVEPTATPTETPLPPAPACSGLTCAGVAGIIYPGIIAILVLALVLWLVFRRRKPKPVTMVCQKCGYKTTQPPGVCPSCGEKNSFKPEVKV